MPAMAVFGVHIRYFGNGGLWFRFYSGSLLANARNAGPAQRSSPTTRCLAMARQACVRPAWLTRRLRSNQDQDLQHGGLKADLSGWSKKQIKCEAKAYLPDATGSKCGSGLAREGGVSVTDELTDPPYSRASPLPQLTACSFRAVFLWELACRIVAPLRCRHLGTSGTQS